MALWYSSLNWSQPLRRSSCRRRLIALLSSLWRWCISVPRALERDFSPKRISPERASRCLRKLVKWGSRHSICRCSFVRSLGGVWVPFAAHLTYRANQLVLRKIIHGSVVVVTSLWVRGNPQHASLLSGHIQKVLGSLTDGENEIFWFTQGQNL